MQNTARLTLSGFSIYSVAKVALRSHKNLKHSFSSPHSFDSIAFMKLAQCLIEILLNSFGHLWLLHFVLTLVRVYKHFLKFSIIFNTGVKRFRKMDNAKCILLRFHVLSHVFSNLCSEKLICKRCNPYRNIKSCENGLLMFDEGTVVI